MRRSGRLALSVVGLLVSAAQVFAQSATPPGTTSSLGVSVAPPPAYESTISALSALATSGAVTLKMSRANARPLNISEAARQILGVTDFPHVSTSEPKRIRHALCMSVPAGIGCGEEGVFRCLDLQI